MVKLRNLLVFVAVLGLLVPAVGHAQGASRRVSRGITIGEHGLSQPDLFDVNVRWDAEGMRDSKMFALNLTLIATEAGNGVPVFRKPINATAKRPTRDYVLSMNLAQQALVERADGLGVAASQKGQLHGGFYHVAWVAHAGELPSVVGVTGTRARCSPVQAGGSYSGCYYGYTDLSDMDLHGATFTDAQFPFSTLTETNFGTANLSYAQFGYANLANANLSNANMTGAYLFGANMKGANLTGTILTNAQFCNTIMPNGTVNNANC